MSRFKLPAGGMLTWFELGRGRPLVLLHGWAMSAAVYHEVGALLADEYRLLIPDLPGHGSSSPAAVNDLAGIAADLQSWLAAVVDAPVGVVGWSLGGMLALQLAHRRDSPLERLVLIGTTPRFTLGDGWDCGLPATQVRALARNLERRFEATLADFFTLAFAGEKISPQRLRAIRTFAVKRSPLPDRAATLGLLGVLAAQDQRDMLAGIVPPALVLHGTLDQIAPLAAGQQLAARLPQGRFAELAGAGHAPFLSRPRQVATRIREFCR